MHPIWAWVSIDILSWDVSFRPLVDSLTFQHSHGYLRQDKFVKDPLDVVAWHFVHIVPSMVWTNYTLKG